MNSAAEIWANVLPLLKSELTETAISTWFSGVTALVFEGNQLVLTHPESFKANIIRTRYLELLKNALRELFASDIDVLVLDPTEAEQFQSAAPTENRNILMGSEEYTFDRFVVGSSNKVAHAENH